MTGAVKDRLIPSPETAEVLGVSPRTIRRFAQQGILTRVKVGGSTRYRLSQIEQIVREGTPPRQSDVEQLMTAAEADR